MTVNQLAAAFASPYVLGHLFALTGTLTVLAYVRRRRQGRVRPWFLAVLVTLSVWAGLSTLGLFTLDPTWRLVVESLALATLPLLAVCWLAFTVSYSARWPSLPRSWVRSLLASAGLFAAPVLTNPLHGAAFVITDPVLQSGVALVSRAETGIFFWAIFVYVTLLVLAGVGVLVDQFESENRRFRRQTLALVVSGAVPLSVWLATLAGPLSSTVDPTVPSLTVTVVALAYVVVSTDGLEDHPSAHAAGEQAVIEAVDQGIVVQDLDGRIVRSNGAADALLGTDGASVVGQDLADAIRSSPLEPVTDVDEVVLSSAEPAVNGARGQRRDDRQRTAQTSTTLRDVDAGLTYDVDVSRIDDPRGPDIGRTLFFRDVTEEQRRKERVRVLNRILRHNLRNDMTVLQGHVALVSETVDDDSVATIEGIAADLADLGETAHRLDRVFREANETSSPVNVAAAVEEVVEEFRVRTGRAIEVRGAVQAWTETNETIVETIATNLVENALERTGPIDGQRAQPDRSAPDPASTGASPTPNRDAMTWQSGEPSVRGDGAIGSAPAAYDARASTDGRGSAAGDGPADSRDGENDRNGEDSRGAADDTSHSATSRSSTADASTDRPDQSDEPQPSPIVVDVRAVGHQVTLTVLDDGPPIPERDVQLLLNGEVSALQHARGSSLWAVQCCVDVADATWSIDSGDRTAITVRFAGEPDLQTAATGF